APQAQTLISVQAVPMGPHRRIDDALVYRKLAPPFFQLAEHVCGGAPLHWRPLPAVPLFHERRQRQYRLFESGAFLNGVPETHRPRIVTADRQPDGPDGVGIGVLGDLPLIEVFHGSLPVGLETVQQAVFRDETATGLPRAED